MKIIRNIATVIALCGSAFFANVAHAGDCGYWETRSYLQPWTIYVDGVAVHGQDWINVAEWIEQQCQEPNPPAEPDDPCAQNKNPEPSQQSSKTNKSSSPNNGDAATAAAVQCSPMASWTTWKWEGEQKTNKRFCIKANQSCDDWIKKGDAACIAIGVENHLRSHSPCKDAVQQQYQGSCVALRAENAC